MAGPENALILSCARGQSSDGLLDPAGGLDWDYVLSMAAAHQVTSLLYWNLHRNCRDRVPPEILQRLRERFLAGVARQERLTAELFRILGHFEENGIPALPFKGPVLAHT